MSIRLNEDASNFSSNNGYKLPAISSNLEISSIQSTKKQNQSNKQMLNSNDNSPKRRRYQSNSQKTSTHSRRYTTQLNSSYQVMSEEKASRDFLIQSILNSDDEDPTQVVFDLSREYRQQKSQAKKQRQSPQISELHYSIDIVQGRRETLYQSQKRQQDVPLFQSQIKPEQKYISNRCKKLIEEEIKNFKKFVDVIQFTPNQMKRLSKYLTLLNYIDQNQIEFLKNLLLENQEEVLSFLFQCLEKCQIDEDLDTFTSILLYLGQMTKDFQMKDRSAFILMQCLTVASLTQNYWIHCNTLLELSLLCKAYELYDEALEYATKALVYAWHPNYLDLEIKTYEFISVCYFYKGQLNMSKLYHNKWALAMTEPQIGYFRQTSQKLIKFYEGTLPFITRWLSRALMKNINLPMQNLIENPPISCLNDKNYRTQSYEHCNGKVILNFILTGEDFTTYRLQHYEIHNQPLIYQIKTNPKRILNRDVLPQKIREIQSRQAKKLILPTLQHKIRGNSDYKMSLEQSIDYRLSQEKEFQVGQLQVRIKNTMNNLNAKYGFQKDQIMNNHLKQKKRSEDWIKKYYPNNIQNFRIIVDRILSRNN